ncbi:uncharacterized protein LOC132173540 [Corylus avellana]|uniref:uncharacterized protein LOC132173540 n=1 Tax=Corylus avellana TaxID=13451 RepID=UPI00286A4762|nr:uncharacterized protein LOC132173540 [Corylus avellana]
MERLSNKWIATVASIWIECSCGLYTFSIYSSVLKSSQGYDQSTLDTVSVFKDIGGSVGILAGVLYSSVTFRNRNRSRSSHSGFGGPWVVHLAGAIQNFVGYFLIWASVVGWRLRLRLSLPQPTPSPAYKTSLIVVEPLWGITKGFLGISGAIVIQVYDTFCKGKPSAVLLILALLPTFVSLVLMFFVRIYNKAINTSDDKKHLNGLTAVALIIAVYLMIMILLENIFTLPSWARIFTFVLLLLLLASPLGIAIKAQWQDSSAFSIERSTPLMQENHESFESSAAMNNPSPAYHEIILPDDEEEGTNLLQAMCTVNFWLLFVATLAGMGTGLAVINNFNQIGQSLNYATLEITNLVSLWSIWSFFGRIGAGYLSDYLLHTRGWARPVLMAITLAGMAAGLFLIAFGFPGILYVGSILVGICFGSQWSLMPTIASEIYGVRHLGTIMNTIGIAIPLGSYIFSVRVIGYFYDEEASGDDDSCFGSHCFMLSFLIMASMAFFGFLVALVLFFRTKTHYDQQVVLSRLKHSLTCRFCVMTHDLLVCGCHTTKKLPATAENEASFLLSQSTQFNRQRASIVLLL